MMVVTSAKVPSGLREDDVSVITWIEVLSGTCWLLLIIVVSGSLGDGSLFVVVGLETVIVET